MVRIPNIHGGGAQTNTNGLQFERDTELLQLIEALPEFTVKGNKVYRSDNNEVVAESFSKHRLYNDFLIPRGVNYKDYISSKLLPDDAFIIRNTCYIIEKKYQAGSGSVDEKLQTFQFKMAQYQKLFSPLGMKVEFYYLINDWFDKPKYEDILNYIENNGARYFFIPNNLIASLNI